ncbi:hypothetical protein HNR39_003320 [Glaciimonas immobilis]|uniref:Uncharacterized protein n=1 Tax=Glaciimonas immobilis TaxID=728004 RepID=A0A840RSJ2_9BURK|nr:hypothetical protein [Glaciimonas immobilis]
MDQLFPFGSPVLIYLAAREPRTRWKIACSEIYLFAPDQSRERSFLAIYNTFVILEVTIFVAASPPHRT